MGGAWARGLRQEAGMFGLGDSGRMLYLPGWAKALIMLVLLASMGAGIYVAVAFIGVPEHTDWIIIGVNAAQVAATGVILALIVLFSESDANIRRLEQRTEVFLRGHLRRALSRITLPGFARGALKAKDVGEKDIFGHLYVLESADDFRFKMWVGANVHRLFVIYFVKNLHGPGYVDRLREIFRFTFGGAEQIGFQPFYEEAVVNGEAIVSIWMSASVDENFLTKPTEKLFWAQDIAMMTQSFLRTALRHGADVEIHTHADPCPL
jgi:hypothetical protein